MTYDQKKLNAESSAARVFVSIDHIKREIMLLQTLMENHDPNSRDNKDRRDCEHFESRLKELLLWDEAKRLLDFVL